MLYFRQLQKRWTVTAEGAADRAQKPQLLHDIFDFMPRGWLRCDRTLGRIIWLGINLDSFPPQIIFCWISWPHYPFRAKSCAKAWAFVFAECSDLCLKFFFRCFPNQIHWRWKRFCAETKVLVNFSQNTLQRDMCSKQQTSKSKGGERINWAARAGVLGAVANDLLLAREPRLNVVLINSSIFILQEETLRIQNWEKVIYISFWSFERRSHPRTHVVEIEVAITGMAAGLQRQKVEKGLSGLSRFPVWVNE